MMNFPVYNKSIVQTIQGNKPIPDFTGSDDKDEAEKNADKEVVEAFGEEWSKFCEFTKKDLERLGEEYFEILPPAILNNKTSVLDVGCGTGRWSKYLVNKVGSISLVDPSKAILVADKLLSENNNVQLAKAYANDLPFAENSFDMVMSIGVLHHIPDTLSAMKECVKRVKPGGYFYTYLYYSFDNRGNLFRFVFFLSNILRKGVSKMPSGMKKVVCDILAVTLYLPLVSLSRFLHWIGLKKLANLIPLSAYRNKSFHIMRNDSLDRFGTKLEQRFSRKQITKMMEESGLQNVVVSPNSPYWHAIGVKPQ
jgi:ubiquinone/menaquinone biosynthesis C-methylase UbiE